jgi:hypothetical protein
MERRPVHGLVIVQDDDAGFFYTSYVVSIHRGSLCRRGILVSCERDTCPADYNEKTLF